MHTQLIPQVSHNSTNVHSCVLYSQINYRHKWERQNQLKQIDWERSHAGTLVGLTVFQRVSRNVPRINKSLTSVGFIRSRGCLLLTHDKSHPVFPHSPVACTDKSLHAIQINISENLSVLSLYHQTILLDLDDSI